MQLTGPVSEVPRLKQPGRTLLRVQLVNACTRLVQRGLQRLQTLCRVRRVERVHKLRQGRATLVSAFTDLLKGSLRGLTELVPGTLIRNLGSELLEPVTQRTQPVLHRNHVERLSPLDTGFLSLIDLFLILRHLGVDQRHSRSHRNTSSLHRPGHVLRSLSQYLSQALNKVFPGEPIHERAGHLLPGLIRRVPDVFLEVVKGLTSLAVLININLNVDVLVVNLLGLIPQIPESPNRLINIRLTLPRNTLQRF